MKKRLLLLVALLLLLSSCGKKAAQPYQMTEGGKTYTVDPQARTVTQGEQVYHYSTTKDSISVTLPDGTTHRKQVLSGGPSEHTSVHVEAYYGAPDGEPPLEDILFSVLTKEYPTPRIHFNLLGLLIALPGLFSLVCPERAWELSWGWRYRDAQPSDDALAVERLTGIFALFFGLLLFFGG